MNHCSLFDSIAKYARTLFNLSGFCEIGQPANYAQIHLFDSIVHISRGSNEYAIKWLWLVNELMLFSSCIWWLLLSCQRELPRRTCIICNVDGGPKIGTTCIHNKILPPFAHIVNLVSRRDLLHQKYITGNLGSCDHCNLLVLTPLSAQISASKFQNLSQILLKIRGVWLKTHSKFKNSLKISRG